MRKLVLETTLLTILLMSSFSVNSAYIDVVGENYFSNDIDGQRWLDLTETSGLSVYQAIGLNPDWRVATSAEVSDMMNYFFPFAHQHIGNSDGLGLKPLFQVFQSIVGSNSYTDSRDTYELSHGLHYTFDNLQDVWTSEAGADIRMSTGNIDVNKPFTYGRYTQYTSVKSYGVWMIQKEAPPAVPIPASVWLFGSGLLGITLVARRRKKTNGGILLLLS